MPENLPTPTNGDLLSGEFPAGSPPTARALDRLSVPGPRTLLMVIVVVRVVLIAVIMALFASAPDETPLGPIVVGAIVVASLAVTGWLALDLRADQVPGATALLLQAAIDALVVTGVVSFTEGATTPVAAMYIGFVSAYALLLPVGRGLIAVAFATVCYVAITLRSFPTAAPGSEFWAQVGVISFVGCMLAVLGNRLAASARDQRVLSAALMQAQWEADQILSTIRSGVITVNGHGQLTYVNPRARRILGEVGFVVGQPVLELIRSRSRDLHDAIAAGIHGGGRVSRGEASVRRPDGSLFPVGVSTTTFRRPGSDLPSVTAIFTDISDLKQLQDFRMRTDRLEAVAALSASLAHEIRNPLAAIRSAVEQLAARVTDDPDDQILAALVMRESERLNRLLGEFLDFSRVRATQFEQVELLGLVREAAGPVIAHPAAEGVEIEIAGDEVEMEADHDLLHRMISNLMLNAVQSLEGKGRVSVTVTEVGPLDPGPGAAERRVKLVVSDNGPGIPEHLRSNLFEPFVTGRTGGSGLGLAIVQRAVSAHRGVIWFDSQPGRGTTFSIFIPTRWDRGEGQ